MSRISARRLISASALSAAAVVALAAPGGASAATQCSGGAIGGQGSSLQKDAQINTWGPDFNTSKGATACSGTQGSKETPTVSYTSDGSGAGIKSFGGKGGTSPKYGPTNAFAGTDAPPSTAVLAEIEAHGPGSKVLTIPVLQAAVTIPVHLPANCLATSEAAPGRLVLGNKTLEKIFAGTVTKWSEIKEGGDTLSGVGCEPAADNITRVVREDGSGTTATFEKYLYDVYKKGVDGSKTWFQLAEEATNTLWPTEGTVVRGNGNGGVMAKIEATEGSIGYANLADARTAAFTEAPGTGGPGTPRFWAEVQNNGGSAVAKYADPSTNGPSNAKANANCKETVYVNVLNTKVKFPPANTELPWNEVGAKDSQKHYALCGFTYDLALTKYSAFGLETTLGEVTTLSNYLTFALSGEAEGGATLIEGKDYLGLPTNKKEAANVYLIAKKGVESIGF